MISKQNSENQLSIGCYLVSNNGVYFTCIVPDGLSKYFV